MYLKYTLGIIYNNFIERNKMVNFKLETMPTREDGIYKTYWHNGNLRRVEHLKENFPDGVSKHYFQNGQLELVANHKNKKREGICKLYYENGQLRSQKNFKNGKMDGLFEGYDETGQLKFKHYYKNGNLDVSEKYDQKGQLELRRHRLRGMSGINPKKFLTALNQAEVGDQILLSNVEVKMTKEFKENIRKILK